MRLSALLTRAVVLAVTLAVVAGALTDVLVLRAVLRDDFAKALRAEATVAARAWQRRGILPIRIAANLSVAVYGADGRLVASEGNALPPHGPTRAGLHWSGARLTVARPLSGGGTVLVWADAFAVVSHPLARLEEILAAVVVASLLATWLAARRIAGQLARPLGDLAAMASAISSGADLDARVHTRSPVTEVQELALAFDAMIDRIGAMFRALRGSEQRERALREATAHDLFTPLATVLANLEMLEDGSLDDADRRRALATARGEADRLRARLARSLGRSVRARARLLDVARRLLSGRPLVDLDGDAPDLAVAADPGEVVEVLDLLVDNAVRHNPPGTRVWVTWQSDGAFAAVAVRDDGPGLATGEHGTASASPGAGLGIGLGLARELVQSRGGDISLAPAADKGTLATVRWPLA